MKIALIGYGKMGRMMEKIAIGRGDEISCRIDMDNQEDFDSEAFLTSDVAIEFTAPGSAAANLERCFRAGVPVVCGTTGWTERLAEFMEKCEHGEGTMMWSSNYSIGVNIFMALNRYLAGVMDSFPQYTPSMTETHHIHKLDHPSGTAITLAEQIIANTGRITSWGEPEEEKTIPEGELEIAHVREGEVPGIHTIKWDSPVDEIILTHSAKSREGFALGAVMAAEWLAGKKGWHTLAEMLCEMTGKDIFK